MANVEDCKSSNGSSILPLAFGGHSSVGRICALQAWGHRFDPGCLHYLMKYLLVKDKRRRVLFATYEKKRRFLLSLYQNLRFSKQFRLFVYYKLLLLPRDSGITRVRNRCLFTNRPRAIYKDFGLSRLMFRKYAWQGKLIGVKKASW